MGKKRAAKGDGSVEPLPNGTFRAAVSRTVNGKRVRSSKVFARASDAHAWRRKQVEQGPVGAGTVGEWVAMWLPLFKDRASPSNYRTDHQTSHAHITPRLGAVRLRDLTPLRVQQWFAAMTGDEVSQGERHKAGRTLRKILNAAVDAHVLPASPMARLTIPRRPEPDTAALTLDELRRLVSAAKGLGREALFAFWADTGLRPAEMFGLKWKDWNPREGVIRVSRAVDALTGKLKETKTRQSRRAIPVGPTNARLVEDYRAGRATDDAPIFPAPEGGHWWHSNFNDHVFQPVIAVAKLTLTPYTLRHTMATLQLQAGTSIKVVSERLGHTDIATTLRSYAHVLPGMQAAAALTMDRLLWGTTPEPTHGG